MNQLTPSQKVYLLQQILIKKNLDGHGKLMPEGPLGGLISGGIGGALGRPHVAAVGGLLGAIECSIRNSFIKSIPAFSK